MSIKLNCDFLSYMLFVIHGTSHFTKLFIATFCPSDKLPCKILYCDFLSYMFCQNAKFEL